MTETSANHKSLALAVMLVSPLFFATNLVFGRAVVGSVAPFTLAFTRWLLVALILLPAMLGQRSVIASVFSSHRRLVFLLSFLGMWLCGGVVYLGLENTTATNATLIYATSPVFIILIEAMFAGRHIRWREAAGSALALVGVSVIVLRGDLNALLSMSFNRGDLLILTAAIAWAGYSILYRSPGLSVLPNVALLGLVAATGAILLLPFAVYEYLVGGPMPLTGYAWINISGIVIFSSLLAFSTFQFGLRELGASLAGVFMYLLPAYGVLLARIVLGEAMHAYHLTGIAMIMGGVILATLPPRYFARFR